MTMEQKVFPDMYSRDSAGNILIWKIRVKEHSLTEGSSMIIIGEGRFNGSITETSTSIHKGKNIGKINETTPLQQALSQAQSRIDKKVKQGYKTLESLGIGINVPQDIRLQAELNKALPFFRTDANDLLKPMKAQKYFKDDGSVRIKFPCFGQPKLNGFRCMARLEEVTTDKGTLLEETKKKVVFRSKEGMAYTCLEHIENDFKKEFFGLGNIVDDLVFDGEMYAKQMSLQEISSGVRKYNPNITPKIKFHIFDIAIPNLNQVERTNLLHTLDHSLRQNAIENIYIVPTVNVNSNEEAQKDTDYWINEGYEGGIFRDKKATYQFGSRPMTMVKLKRSMDQEFKIIDVVGGDNTPDLGVFVCVAPNGKHFKVTPEGNEELKKKYLSNKTDYIGKLLTVRFFEWTNEGKPFHGIGVTIRDYE